MAIQPGNILHNVLDISHPWEISIMNYSNRLKRVDICLNFTDTLTYCPVCNAKVTITSHVPYIFNYLDLNEYETYITAYLPIIDTHNLGCSVRFNQSFLQNIYFLDLLMGIEKNSKKFGYIIQKKSFPVSV